MKKTQGAKPLTVQIKAASRTKIECKNGIIMQIANLHNLGKLINLNISLLNDYDKWAEDRKISEMKNIQWRGLRKVSVNS